MRTSLRARLTLALAGIALAAVAVTALGSVGSVRRYASERARSDLARIAGALATDDAVVGDRPLTLPFVRRVLRINGDEIAVVRATGEVNGQNAVVNDLARSLAGDLRAGRGSSGEWRGGGATYAYVATPVAAARRAGQVGVVLARPVRVTREAVGPLVSRLLVAGLVAVLLAAVAAFALARGLVEPVRAISAAAARVARGDHSQPVPVRGEDELGLLARSFNDMSTALDEAQRRQREFLASVSHELRTPVTAIKGYAEALAEGAVEGEEQVAEAIGIIRAESARLERMVHDVVELARVGTSEFSLAMADVDLAPAVEQTVAAHAPQARDAGVDLRANVDGPLRIRTDATRVQQVLANLLSNALRVTPAAGTVTVDARDAGGAIQIEVSDTGPGIESADLPHVFERAYLWRASQGTRPVGTGMGLAIVRELVAALGGTVAVASQPGRGSRFTVSLPL